MSDVIETTETEPQIVEEDATVQLAKMREALNKANKEAERSRKKLAEFEAAEQSRQQAELTELERVRNEKETAERRAQEAEDRAKQTLIRAAFVAEAARQGAAYPDDVYRLADASGVEVQDDGTVAGVAEAVKVLVDSGRIPLVGKTPAPKLDGGAGGLERPASGLKLTPQEAEIAKKMNISPEAYLKQKAAIAARSE